MQKNLVAWRRFHNITQKEIAGVLGIDLRTYINKEHGVTQFKADEMFAIAKILNKNISEIFLPSDFMENEVKDII
jgi:transcriptional regulator with XRE-family HTH domain